MFTLRTQAFDALSTRELYALLALRAEVFVVEQECAYQDVDGLDPQSTHVNATRDGELVGYLRWYSKGPATAVGRVVTRASARGVGLARRLMEHAMAEISGPITLEAQCYLVDFYRSLGFSPVGQAFILDGIPHQRMDKSPS